jgi:hypothetical protein
MNIKTIGLISIITLTTLSPAIAQQGSRYPSMFIKAFLDGCMPKRGVRCYCAIDAIRANVSLEEFMEMEQQQGSADAVQRKISSDKVGKAVAECM